MDLCHKCPLASAPSYNPKLASGSLQITSRNDNVFNNSVIGEGLSASHRYLPNEHHRVVANISLDSAGNHSHWRNISREPNAARCVLSPYRRLNKFDQYKSLVDEISLKRYQECQTNSLCVEVESKEADNYQENYRATVSKLRGNSSVYCENDLLSDGKVSALAAPSLPEAQFSSIMYSRVMKPSHMEYNFPNNFAESYSHPNMQILRQILPVSENRAPFLINTQAYSAEQDTSQFMPRNKDSGSTHLRPQSLHCGFDQNEFLLKDKNLQEQHMLGRNSNLPPLQSEMASNRSWQMKNNMILEQISQKANDALTQPQEHLSPIKDCSVVQMSSTVACESRKSQRVAQLNKLCNVLLLYEHASHCQLEAGECSLTACVSLKRDLCHMSKCEDKHCSKQCVRYNALFNHYRNCHSSTCYLCVTVKEKLKRISCVTESKTTSPTAHVTEFEQSAAKRVKMEHPAVNNSARKEAFQVSVPMLISTQPPMEAVSQASQEDIMSVEVETDNQKQIMQLPANSSVKVIEETCEATFDLKVETRKQCDVDSVEPAHVSENCTQAKLSVGGSPKVGLDAKCKSNFSAAMNVSSTKMANLKTKTLSLLDTFTPEKIKEHIRSLENSFDQGKAKAEIHHVLEQAIDQNSCSLCGMDELLFEPPPRYCATCFKHINPKGVYYCMKSSNSHEANTSLCGKCFSASGENIKVGEKTFQKSNLEKRMNYAEVDAETEAWVLCDKCGSRQHQICALFNRKRKDVLLDEYICPNCYMQEIECGKREPLPPNSVLGAKDLPTTKLSNHLEQWLFIHLKQEREERACMLGKNSNEIPGAEGLIIRVVSSVDKKLVVNPHFHGIFYDENYPTEFPYKSKVILLFQNIDGSDVCLFAMYVQEYGSECPCPNQRRVCISYIDSVKYFRPEVKVVTGEALRTFVYHEILVGYLNYCKNRGFTSCYIWSCPSLRQDYYILYCHPKVQKSPRPEKLREWYQLMIRKAMKENIVVEQTNLYDHFFVLKSECKVKVTAARLPYFDGDFWPGKAESFLHTEPENEKQTKETKAIIDRALRAAKRDFSTRNPKDILLMHQLGEVIRQTKEDFFIVHLFPECKHCCQPILSGKQWLCNACKNFQLCEQCYDKEVNLEKKDRHPLTAREKHSFQLAEVDIPADTLDEDELMQSDPFDLRTAFLSFCQSNQYQFDTLRRAKHSTMMILYHLHNQMVPHFTSTCVCCRRGIVTGQSWHCTNCPGYSLCDLCHQNGASQHEHGLVSHINMADHAIVQKQGTRASNTQNLLIVLVHASNCHDPCCAFFCCRKVKLLFRHGKHCKIRAKGGCVPCNKIWHILQLHIRACSDLECHVPRCKDLKNYMKQIRQQPGFVSGSKEDNGQTRR